MGIEKAEWVGCGAEGVSGTREGSQCVVLPTPSTTGLALDQRFLLASGLTGEPGTWRVKLSIFMGLEGP